VGPTPQSFVPAFGATEYTDLLHRPSENVLLNLPGDLRAFSATGIRQYCRATQAEWKNMLVGQLVRRAAVDALANAREAMSIEDADWGQHLSRIASSVPI